MDEGPDENGAFDQRDSLDGHSMTRKWKNSAGTKIKYENRVCMVEVKRRQEETGNGLGSLEYAAEVLKFEKWKEDES